VAAVAATVPVMHAPVDPRSRREWAVLVARSALRIGATIALLLTLYALAPGAFGSAADALPRLVAVAGLVAAVIALQVRAIVAATHPELRVVEALVTALTVFLVLFALLYLGLAQADPASFTQPLDRVGALSFTVTVLAPVGCGDLAARTAGARLVVTAQMLLDLVLLAVVVRVFAAAARAGAARRADRQADERGAPRR
jgi:voltage-gated potassium channel